ncbi:hypothetical protein IT407_04560 [Candidatus Uhrbacteria bacterium]|nr:hypothetical protein [Candidatus Uhrbacteria bacterium]
MAIDIFRGKHSEYLHSIERIWARYEPRRNSLVLYLQASIRLPPAWIHSRLKIQACDLNGSHLTELAMVWTNVNGSPLHGEAVCPSELRPSADKRFLVRIGDFVLHAGESERILPNDQPALQTAFDPRDDRRL